MEFTRCETLLPSYFRPSYTGAPMPVYLSYDCRLAKERITALHYHASLEIGICLSGSGMTVIDDRVYRFRAGDLQWALPYQPHLSAADPGSDTRWLWIFFEPLRLLLDAGAANADAFADLCAKGYSGVFHPEEYPAFAALIARFRAEAERKEDPLRKYELAFLSGEMLVEAARIGQTEDAKTERGGFGRVLPAVKYIGEHYAEKEAMREERIAALLGVRPSYLRLLFRRETGIPPRTFILQTRLAAAEFLLRTTRQSVLSVAMDCGFEQISCFNRAFRREYGKTPGEYRRDCRK